MQLMDLQQKLSERLQCKVCWENDVATVRDKELAVTCRLPSTLLFCPIERLLLYEHLTMKLWLSCATE
jgi:hypothetical protein